MTNFTTNYRYTNGESTHAHIFAPQPGKTEVPCVVLSGAFTPEECSAVRRVSINSEAKKATVHTSDLVKPGHNLDLKSRDVNIVFKLDLDALGFNRVWGLAGQAAHEQWVLPEHAVEGNDGWQLLTYHVGGHYREHTDNCVVLNAQWELQLPNRYISVVAFFSDHGEDFTGGELSFPRWFFPDGSKFQYTPRKGDLVVFPSGPQSSHQVEKVTAGIRISAATWAGKKLPRAEKAKTSTT